MRIGVVTFPGSLDDVDAARAVRLAGGEAVPLWHGDHELKGVDAVVLPGGFSYGDYLRCGAISRFSPVMTDLVQRARDGMPLLGICNGFQILCEAHLLPGALLRNAGLTFVSKPVDVVVERTGTAFTSAYEPGVTLRLPVAHGDGRYVAADDTLRMLEAEGRVVLRYVATSESSPLQPNPNGSANHIAGICNAAGTVVGIMPHPERIADPLLGVPDGLGFFTSLAAWQPRDATLKVTSR
jgi:phosphoribosylformylglycinamidine synthase subunit PurQ / glutaminase